MDEKSLNGTWIKLNPYANESDAILIEPNTRIRLATNIWIEIISINILGTQAREQNLASSASYGNKTYTMQLSDSLG